MDYDDGMDGLLDRLWRRFQALFIPTVGVTSALATLVVHDQAKRNDAVLQLYSWERDRLLTLAKGLAGTAVTVTAGLIADTLESKVTSTGAVVYLSALLVAELYILSLSSLIFLSCHLAMKFGVVP